MITKEDIDKLSITDKVLLYVECTCEVSSRQFPFEYTRVYNMEDTVFYYLAEEIHKHFRNSRDKEAIISDVMKEFGDKLTAVWKEIVVNKTLERDDLK